MVCLSVPNDPPSQVRTDALSNSSLTETGSPNVYEMGSRIVDDPSLSDAILKESEQFFVQIWCVENHLRYREENDSVGSVRLAGDCVEIEVDVPHGLFQKTSFSL